MHPVGAPTYIFMNTVNNYTNMGMYNMPPGTVCIVNTATTQRDGRVRHRRGR